MVIQHNLMALNTQRAYGIVTNTRAKTTEKLASGYRINRSADDAAGLSISEKMRRQIRGLFKGVENAKEGISLCQVADGALNEVNEMLHRITELSVKAANGTNSEEECSYIQREVHEILTEIDRIGNTTTFNEEPIFKGNDKTLTNADGTVAIMGQIPFGDFKLVDVKLGQVPFAGAQTGNDLLLSATVRNPDSAANGESFNLIFGNGSTSSSSLKVKYTDSAGNAKERIIKMEEFQQHIVPSAGSQNTLSWKRELIYSDVNEGLEIKITQGIGLYDGKDEKNYQIKYKFEDAGSSSKINNLGFMFHADTAYNNNDTCEGYFIDGGNNAGVRVDTCRVYDKKNGKLDIDSFSIVDVDNALTFTEKINFSSASPDSVYLGYYNSIHDWDYPNNGEVGQPTERRDMGFSLVWNDVLSGTGEIGFKYGIAAVEKDKNVSKVPLKMDNRVIGEHNTDHSVWIHSGCEAGDGIWVDIGEMNTGVLGIKDIDVSTVGGAKDALGKVKNALKNLTLNRSRIGAQQNRLEHAIANEENVVENTTAAESRIRDADMAKEMVSLARDNILDQVGQAMQAQANQVNQGVLSLLQ